MSSQLARARAPSQRRSRAMYHSRSSSPGSSMRTIRGSQSPPPRLDEISADLVEVNVQETFLLRPIRTGLPSSHQSEGQTAGTSRVPTFHHGVTTADPAVTWSILRALEVQHTAIAEIHTALSLPSIPVCPFQMGPDPAPHIPPWDLFPPWNLTAQDHPTLTDPLEEEIAAIDAWIQDPEDGTASPVHTIEELSSPTSIIDNTIFVDDDLTDWEAL